MSSSELTEHLRMTIAGGGTGGHVLPVVAVIEELRRRPVHVQFQWIGSQDGIEREEARIQNIPYVSIQTGKLRRYFDLHTIPDTIKIPVGAVQAWRALRGFRPDVIFSSGGYVSFPTVFAAWSTPVLTHEQTAVLGLATRLDMRFCDVAALSHDSTAALMPTFKGRTVVTGNPVRPSILEGTASRCRQHFSLSDHLPLIYVTGGARGAEVINERIEAILPILLTRTQVIHQSGPSSANGDFTRLSKMRSALSEDVKDRYHVREYIREELADVLAAADVVIGRAGAGTVSELALLGKPSILIPLPGSGGGEQHANARVLGDAGGAVVVDQDDATPDRLLEEITRLLENREYRESIGSAARAVATPDASARLADELLKLARESK